jgi:amino acid transporter
VSTPQGPEVSLPQTWRPLDFALHAFLVVAPFGLGLWMFSLAPLVGGNLFLAFVLGSVVVLLGAVVVGSLADRRPWTGGDYAWQTRFLSSRAGAVVALGAWWLGVALIAPVYGNVLLVQFVEPFLTFVGADDLASWFLTRDGNFVCSLIVIAIATAFVGIGMRRAAIVQRVLVVIGLLSVLTMFGLLLSGGPQFRDAFDEESAEYYGTSPLAASQIVEVGGFDADVTEVEPSDTLRLVPLVLLFCLWIGWAGPLAGEVRAARPGALRAALFRAGAASMLLGLVFLFAIGRGTTWDLWNEANNLYWGTVYGTTPATPLTAWPNPVVFATWLTDVPILRGAVILGMAAWIVGLAATLFLAATRVLLAAAADGALPRSFGPRGDGSLPTATLALLVVPACALAGLDAYWDSFASWSAAAVLALAASAAATALAAARAIRHDSRPLAVAACVFAATCGAALLAWALDPVFGIRTIGALAFLVALYAVVATVLLVAGRSPSTSSATADTPT